MSDGKQSWKCSRGRGKKEFQQETSQTGSWGMWRRGVAWEVSRFQQIEKFQPTEECWIVWRCKNNDETWKSIFWSGQTVRDFKYHDLQVRGSTREEEDEEEKDDRLSDGKENSALSLQKHGRWWRSHGRWWTTEGEARSWGRLRGDFRKPGEELAQWEYKGGSMYCFRKGLLWDMFLSQN